MSRHLLLGLACIAGGAQAATGLTLAGGKYTLALDYLEVMLGASKSIYKANLVSSNLSSFAVDVGSIGSVAANSAADPATTPRLNLVNGRYVLEIPSVSLNGQTYAVNLGSSDTSNFSVDTSSLKSVSSNKPTSVAIANVDTQTVGATSISSTTKLKLSWVAPSTATATSYKLVARETDGVGKVETTAVAGATTATLSGLKAATAYAINLTACFNTACTSQATAAAVSATTPGEYWQLQGSGNGYAAVTKAVSDGNSLSWVMRWGSDAGASYSGRYQYYFKSNNFAAGGGIGIAATTGSAVDVTTLTSFATNTAAGLRNPCADPNSSTGCPSSAAYFINAIQVVPLKSDGKLRAFFEAFDATESGKPTRIYALDSQDGLIGQDFNSSSTKAYCSGTGSTDFASGGSCEPSVVLGVASDSGSRNSPLTQARQFKIGWDWLADWRWDQAAGTFMIITGADACGKATNGLFQASWDGSKWTVVTDSAGCAVPLANAAHGPVLVPLGGAGYKLYYEDETNGPTSGKPLRLIYADGSWSGSSGTVDIGDWEASSKAREVHFLWPDGTLLDAQDEAGLGDHMILTPAGTLDQQFMFVNLGGFDNTKWNAASSGLGVAKLLNP